MPAGRHLLSRRTTLAVGAAGLVVVAGCDDDTGRSGDPRAAPTPAEDPDGGLVDAVLEALAGAEKVAGRFPDLVALHRAHIEALDGTAPTAAPRRAPVDVVRRSEKRLQSLLVESAVSAESGALARLLASMSAAVAQQLAVLTQEVA